MQHPFVKNIFLAFVGLLLIVSLLGYSGVNQVNAQNAAFFVAPNGKSSNNGSVNSPWDLQTALNQPSAVRPGARIYLRGGTYKGMFTSKLNGTASAPIIVRNHANERVILTNSSGPALDLANTSHVYFWGLEISGPDKRRSTSRSESTYGVRVNQGKSSHNIKFISMIFHDVQAQGIGWWQALKDSEIHGSLFYYNGTTQLDHGVYAHNVSGTKLFINNMVFNNASHGFHGYAETNAKGLNNIVVKSNTFFNNGSIGYNTRKEKYGIMNRNILMGGLIATNNAVVTQNFTYHKDGNGIAFNLGYKGGSNNATVTNNYFMGGKVEFGATNKNVTMFGNHFFSPGGITGVNVASYANNSVYTSKPKGVQYFIRSNLYDLSRANITIYNWAKQDYVFIPADRLAAQRVALKPGQAFELRSAQNYFGDVITGVYNGNGISVPMTGRSVAQPLGLDFKPPSTFPEFGAFILIAK